jgi:hypothetical protein
MPIVVEFELLVSVQDRKVEHLGNGKANDVVIGLNPDVPRHEDEELPAGLEDPPKLSHDLEGGDGVFQGIPTHHRIEDRIRPRELVQVPLNDGGAVLLFGDCHLLGVVGEARHVLASRLELANEMTDPTPGVEDLLTVVQPRKVLVLEQNIRPSIIRKMVIPP